MYVLAYLNFIFEFQSSFSTAQKYKFHLNFLEHSISFYMYISGNNTIFLLKSMFTFISTLLGVGFLGALIPPNCAETEIGGGG